MMAQHTETKSARGRPRSIESHARILEATLSLLATTGWTELSIDKVATQAKVGKQTIYKWWGSKSALVMEAALDTLEEKVKPINSGKFEVDLLTFLKRSVRTLDETSVGVTLAALIAEAQHDKHFAQQFRERFLATRRNTMRIMVQRGLQRGELRCDLDVDLLLDTVFGTFWYRLLTAPKSLNKKFVDEFVQFILPQVLASPARNISQKA